MSYKRRFRTFRDGRAVYDVRLLSETRGSIRTSIGMSVATDPFDRANRPTESTVERYACEDTPKDGCTFD